jgi:hypothetical protein
VTRIVQRLAERAPWAPSRLRRSHLLFDGVTGEKHEVAADILLRTNRDDFPPEVDALAREKAC